MSFVQVHDGKGSPQTMRHCGVFHSQIRPCSSGTILSTVYVAACPHSRVPKLASPTQLTCIYSKYYGACSITSGTAWKKGPGSVPD